MKRKLILFIGCLAATFVSLALQSDQQDPDLERVVRYMTGHFHSGAQAQEDSSYFEIHLNTARIWPGRTDGYWLYVEQAAAGSLQEPYRQRVYHVHRDRNEKIVSAVYELKDAAAYTGTYTTPEVFDELNPEKLQRREGCDVFIDSEGLAFTGSTVAGHCASKLRGSSYASSHVHITSDTLKSWDRGYNSNNEQVWGAEKGAYVFVRQ